MDHQRALKNSQAFNESLGRRKAEFELNKAMRLVRETENSYGSQIGTLRERILNASEELQRSVEERGMMKSQLQSAQQRIDQMNSHLREVEISRSELERQKSNDTKLEKIKNELEVEIRQMRRQLEQAKESERVLNQTVNRVEGRSDQSRREIMELERELRVLRSENSILQSQLATNSSRPTNTVTSRVKPPASLVTGTPIIPNIPIIKVPSSQKQQPVPLEILIDSPVQRRNMKRLSTGKISSSPAKKGKPAATVLVTSTPTAATPTTTLMVPSSNENLNNNLKNGLGSLLEGVGKKKIKLPERPAKITITTTNSNNSEIPRSTPISKIGIGSTDPSVMESIISSFNVKIPTDKN